MKTLSDHQSKGRLFSSTVPSGGKAAAGAREMRIVQFPKEFQKDFWKSLDKRIITIFAVNFVVIYGMLIFAATRPKAPVSDQLDTRLLKKIANVMKVDPKLLEELDKPAEDPDKEATAVSQTSTIKAPTNAAGKASRAAAAKAAAASRAGKAAKAAAGRGVLAVAGAVGGSGGKYAAVDFSGSSSGLDAVLGQLGGIGEASGGSEKTVLGAGGGSVGGGGGIDELASLLEGSGGVSVIGGAAGSGLIGIGKASVSGGGGGGASAADIQGVIDQNAAAINSCYQKELKKQPDLKGKLSVQIKINPAGRVAGVTVTQNTVNASVAQCVQNKIRGWSFPRGKKGMITVSQTFVFTK